MGKKIILLDLDGVLNSYDGHFDINFIPPIRRGAVEFIRKISEDFEIKLFTTRNKILASKWLIQNNLTEYITDVTDKKELAWLFVDDRCIKFDGCYEALVSDIINFKPWYKL